VCVLKKLQTRTICSLCFSSFSPYSLSLDWIETKLVPFQIVYITNDDSIVLPEDGSATNPMDDMTVLSVTRTHLEEVEFQQPNTDFVALMLYQTVRTNTMFTNGTKIAFTGSAIYDWDGLESSTPPDHMIYLCFLGQNETAYVEALRSAGWANLERALLMTMTGSMVRTNEKGTEFYIENDNNGMNQDSTSTKGTMDKNLSKTIILVSVFVPLSLVFVFGTCLVCYLLRYNTQWNRRQDTNIHPVWINITTTTKKRLRRWTFDGSMTGHHTNNDSGSDELTVDVASVQLDTANPRKVSQPTTTGNSSRTLNPPTNECDDTLQYDTTLTLPAAIDNKEKSHQHQPSSSRTIATSNPKRKQRHVPLSQRWIEV
jgi:hypothetical protein